MFICVSLISPKVSNTACVFETQRSIWPDEGEGIWAGVLFFLQELLALDRLRKRKMQPKQELGTTSYHSFFSLL